MSEVDSGECACPLCDDYSGPRSSVEAHISRKTDEAHKGEVGRLYRDELEASEAVDEEGAEERVESAPEGEQSGDSESDEEQAESAPEPLDEEERADVEADLLPVEESSDEDDDEPPGAPGVEVLDEVEEATAKAERDGLGGLAVVLATLGLIAVALFGGGGGGGTSAAEIDDDQDDEQDDDQTTDMPLWDE